MATADDPLISDTPNPDGQLINTSDISLNSDAAFQSDTKQLTPERPTKTNLSLDFPIQEDLVSPTDVETFIYTTDGNNITINLYQPKEVTCDWMLNQTLSKLKINTQGRNIFALWITSPLLSLQLKPTHKPIKLLIQWKLLLATYTDVVLEEIELDQPHLELRRCAFLSLREERRITDELILKLLFCEAKVNFLQYNYPIEQLNDVMQLGAYLLILDHKEFIPDIHTANWLLSEDRLRQYLPAKLCDKKQGWIFTPLSKLISFVQQLINAFQAQSIKNNKQTQSGIHRLFLQYVYSLPMYGATLFRGQVARPINNMRKFLGSSDRSIIILLNSDCLHILDAFEKHVLFRLPYDHMSWQFQPTTKTGDKTYCSLWLEFDSKGPDGEAVSKQLQLFSRQAPLMDALIQTHVHALNRHDMVVAEAHGSQPASSDDVILPQSALILASDTPKPKLGEKQFSLITYATDGNVVPDNGIKRRLSKMGKKNKKNFS